MTATLLLRSEAPMQSWGYQSRFEHRGTAAEPTKSGVVGLLAAALGRPRTADLRDLATLRMAVRCDREGRVERDYHTANGVPTTDGRSRRTITSDRFYLADACFLVALEGDRPFLDTLAAALRRPCFPLFLGRRAFPAPPDLLIGIKDGSAIDNVRRHPLLGRRHEANQSPNGLRVLYEVEPGAGLEPDARAETRNDQPLSFASDDRRYGPRHVRSTYVSAPTD